MYWIFLIAYLAIACIFAMIFLSLIMQDRAFIQNMFDLLAASTVSLCVGMVWPFILTIIFFSVSALLILSIVRPKRMKKILARLKEIRQGEQDV